MTQHQHEYHFQSQLSAVQYAMGIVYVYPCMPETCKSRGNQSMAYPGGYEYGYTATQRPSSKWDPKRESGNLACLIP